VGVGPFLFCRHKYADMKHLFKLKRNLGCIEPEWFATESNEDCFFVNKSRASDHKHEIEEKDRDTVGQQGTGQVRNNEVKGSAVTV